LSSPDNAFARRFDDERETALELDGVSRVFAGRAVLNNLSLNVKRGQFVSMLGASGAGKTTLLRILAGLDQADSGRVRVAGARSVVFQEPRLVPAKRVWENVVIGHGRLGAAKPSALAALDEVGLTPHADGWPKTLSGGEAQRVALARALVREPKLLLLDEPFAALDALTRLRMQDLVRQLVARHGPGVLLVTHDVDEALRLADRIVVLREGRLTLDVSVNGAAGHREAAHAEGGALRARLYAELGVPHAVAA